MKKLPEILLTFWIMKICATTLGETAGDMLAHTFNFGYAFSSMILLAFFLITLFFQLVSKKYHPTIYWLVILSTSTVGTEISDYMDRTLGLGYPLGASILVATLCGLFLLWFLSEKSLSVTNISTTKGEVFYWLVILCSNTLGTALGDFLADSSGLGFAGGAILIGTLIALTILAYFYTKISHIFLFWIAFILTRPFGATFGDLLTKPQIKGGLGFGTIGASLVLVTIFIITITYEHLTHKTRLKTN